MASNIIWYNMVVMLRVFDNLKKQYISHSLKKTIGIYVCGPTVYDHCHVGHGRSLLVFDVLHRLTSAFTEVLFVQNITDVNEKIIKKAREMSMSPEQVADIYTQSFFNIRALLNIKLPTFTPKVSDFLREIMQYIQILINKKHAYITSRGVYFNRDSIPIGGFFEKRCETLSRIEVDEEKKNQEDFALWKFDLDGFESPWGSGYPGWHIECSAMSLQHLGSQFTIHGGGTDLQFPHHENEILQSLGANNCIPAEIWMHNAMITVQDEKMSKSLGNFQYLHELVTNKYKADVFRYYILSSHYAKDMNFTMEGWEQAEKSLLRLRHFYFRNKDLIDQIEDMDHQYLLDLQNDLNTPLALQTLFGCVKNNNLVGFKTLISVLGFKFDINTDLSEKLIEQHINFRSQYKKEGNFEQADQIRQFLLSKFIELVDTGQETIWYYV